MVYPKIPVPKNRPSEPPGPRVRGFTSGGGARKARLAAIVAGAAVAGGVTGFLVRPTHGGEVAQVKADLASAQKAATSEKERADGLDQQLTKFKQDNAELATKAAEVDKKAAELADEEKKIQGTIDKSQGSVTTEGDEIHLKLVDKVLFAVGDDQLTDKGKAVLDKVAAALKDLPDKQVWVQGHTDDQPIYVAPKKDDPKDAKAKGKAGKVKDAKDTKDAKPPPVRFVTNWELSAARALQVVHYLQDVGKVEPTRLAALAFGQYRPISRTNKALNRRIEIVLYPKREILSK